MSVTTTTTCCLRPRSTRLWKPCTKGARTVELESCSELICQHKFERVFVGMLDPNQAVTGKGLWRLQDAGIEVALFPSQNSLKKFFSQKCGLHSRAAVAQCRDNFAQKPEMKLATYENAGTTSGPLQVPQSTRARIHICSRIMRGNIGLSEACFDKSRKANGKLTLALEVLAITFFRL